jgi:hypothetical protein
LPAKVKIAVEIFGYLKVGLSLTAGQPSVFFFQGISQPLSLPIGE